jgi:hypothetical protein
MTTNKTKEIYILESPKGIISRFNFNPIEQAELKGREDMRKEILDFINKNKGRETDYPKVWWINCDILTKYLEEQTDGYRL